MDTNLTSGLAHIIQGTWWLISREDYTREGELKIDPILGRDPIGILCYTKNHFAAQFMKRNRSEGIVDPSSNLFSAQNNTSAINGYDAYFGTYYINHSTGEVVQTLIGALAPANVGLIVHRNMKIENAQLVIHLQTTTSDGILIDRTLIWKRVG